MNVRPIRAPALALTLAFAFAFALASPVASADTALDSPIGTYYVTDDGQLWQESNGWWGLQREWTWNGWYDEIPPDTPVVGAVVVCFDHNPNALTNACLRVGPGRTDVRYPTVSPSWTAVCVIGDVCASVPTGGTTGWRTVTMPGIEADGYVEATVLCRAMMPCGVALGDPLADVGDPM